MSSVKNSVLKLGQTLREMMLRDSHKAATANWREVMREHWGKDFEAPESDEMILVDSTLTIHPPAEASPTPVEQLPVAKEVTASQPSTVGTLAKVAMAFAVGGPIGAGLAAIPIVQSYLSRPATVAQPTPVETPEIPTIKPNIYGLELVPPK